jgi:hypothetical protein
MELYTARSSFPFSASELLVLVVARLGRIGA